MIFSTTTYNILSSSLASPYYFNKCLSEDLDSKNRMERLQDILEREMKIENNIICLQELSCEQEGQLQSFFHSHKYTLMTVRYGSKFTNYMGVGIAFPNELELVRMKSVRIADTTNWKKDIYPCANPKWAKILNNPIGWLKSWFCKPKETDEQNARKRWNSLLFCEFKKENKSFCIGTYHMPCAFYSSRIMTWHAFLVAREMQKLCEEKPYILAGDFNFKPDSVQYNMLTKGDLPEKDVDEGYFNYDFFNYFINPMGSAYKDKNGKEPKYTNFSQTRNQSEPFIDCLDYIFYRNAKVLSVLELSESDKLPFPTETQPSDHLCIRAKFQI